MAATLSAHDLQAIDARRAVATALRLGEIERQPCVECGGPAEAHHHLGYAPEHWLDVEWLCRSHHSRRHFLSTQKWTAVKWAKGAPLTLREIRTVRAVTQVELAARLAVAQSNVSAVEGRKDVALSTLRA